MFPIPTSLTSSLTTSPLIIHLVSTKISFIVYTNYSFVMLLSFDSLLHWQCQSILIVEYLFTDFQNTHSFFPSLCFTCTFMILSFTYSQMLHALIWRSIGYFVLFLYSLLLIHGWFQIRNVSSDFPIQLLTDIITWWL